MHTLALIIPAYKIRFLQETLLSIVNQVDKRFHLYVFDDASPDKVEDMLYLIPESINYTYHRFGENLGQISLSAHWTRCIKLTIEPWIWFISDDDLMDVDCVETFLRYLELNGEDQTSVYRFPMQIIDEKDALITPAAKWPGVTSAGEFLDKRLSFEWMSSINEYVFSRKAFESVGFQDFPLGWCVDDAAWISLSEQGGIITLPGGKVSWRASRYNLSGKRNKVFGEEKLKACFLFLKWLDIKAINNYSLRISRSKKMEWLLGHGLMLREPQHRLLPGYAIRIFKQELGVGSFLKMIWKAGLLFLKGK